MEAKWLVVTAVAPVTWGATYVVTRQWLPVDAPLWGAAGRALPAGLLLLALVRMLPHGAWWWRSAVLGVVNVAGFFVLVYLAAQLLPSSVAASVMALSPVALAGLGWVLLAERPSRRVLVGAGCGVVGVLVLLGGAGAPVSPRGVLASLGALVMFSVGGVLGKRWRGETPVLRVTAWQLTSGGVVLLVTAAVVEGSPPVLNLASAAALAFTSLAATAVAFVCWFAGLARLPVAVVGVVGLLNPLTGVGLGTALVGESLSPAQVAGLVVALLGVLLAVTAGDGRRLRLPRAAAARSSTRSRRRCR